MSFIFGGDTGASYEDVQKKRRVADALLLANTRTPQNVGEGLNAIGRALAARAIEKRASAREGELRDAFNSQWEGLFGGGLGMASPGVGSGGTYTAPAPAAPQSPELPPGMGQTPLSYSQPQFPAPVGGQPLSYGQPQLPEGLEMATPEQMAKGQVMPPPSQFPGAVGEQPLGYSNPQQYPQPIAEAKLALPAAQPPAPQGWDAIRNGIFAGESGGDYDALFGYENRPGGAFQNVKLTDMTVADALAFSDPSGPYAQSVKRKIGRVATPMGAYQVVGSTLREAVKGLGLTGNEKMTPELQDRIGQWIYQTQGTGAWEGYRGPQSGGDGVRVAQADTGIRSDAGGYDIGTLAEIAGSPFASPGQKAVVNALLQQQMQAADPMYRLQLEREQLELAQLREGGGGQDPAGYRELALRAEAAGLQPGTPEYQQFMLSGGGGIREGRPAAFEALHQQALAAGLVEGTDPYKQFMLTKGAGEAARAKEIGATSGTAAAELPGAEAMLGTLDTQINDLINDPYLDRMLGSVDSRLPNVSSSAARVQSRINQLGGGAFLQARQMLKGGGAITDFESQRAEEAFARLSTAQQPEDFKKALEDFRAIVKQGVQKLQGQAQMGGESGQSKVYRFNPETGELE